MKYKLILFSLFFIALINVASAMNFTNMSKLYYDFDSYSGNIVTDESPKGLNGNMLGYTTITEGRIGRGAYIPLGSMINITANPTNGSTPFSMFAWIKNNDSGRTQDIISYGTTGAGRGTLLYIYTDNALHFDLVDIAGATGGYVTDNQWHHVGVVYNGSTSQLYLDGATSGSPAITAANIYDSKRAYVGASVSTNYGTYKGWVDEVGIWNRSLSSEEVSRLYARSIGISQYDLVALGKPFGNATLQTTMNFTAGFNAIPSLNLSNATIKVWNGNSTLVNSTTYTITGQSNQTNIIIPNLGIGDYLWNVYACQNSTTVTTCGFARYNQTFLVGINLNINYTSPLYETESGQFILNSSHTSKSIFSLSSSSIYFGGALRGGQTITNPNAIDRLFNNTFDIPLGFDGKNITSFWSVFTSNGLQINTTVQENEVRAINFSICGASPLNTPFINFTFKDESSLINLNATLPSSTFEYWLGSGTVKKSLSYSSTIANISYAFCFTPTDKTLKLDPYIQYSDTGYPQRIYDADTLSLTSTLTTKVLYLLSSSSGLYVTFQVINAAEQPLESVLVNITRSIGGDNVLLGSGLTGASGTITFWMNPDFEHTANFYLSPYPLYTTTQAFSNSEYTVTLGSVASANVSDYHSGITYSVRPIDSYLSNGTFYLFNFTLGSSYWDLDQFGFNITNEEGILVASNMSTSGSGGSLLLNMSTEQNSTFYINYYWIVNGTITSAARSWTIIDLSGNSFSLSRLISDFSAYVILGFFGLDDFGVGIICFVIILAVVGIVKTKWGVSDETVLVGLVFALVALFDVSFGLIPNPVGAVAHFPTILIGLIFSGFVFKEVFQ